MITSLQINRSINASVQQEMPYGLGNTLFIIAGVIGIAIKNGYEFAFPQWINQEYFVNPLPALNKPVSVFKNYQMPVNYKGFDVGFRGFNVPDNSSLYGYFGSYKYFEHCEDIIRHYFTLKEMPEIKSGDWIVMHYRDYNNAAFASLDDSYYLKALVSMPKKPVIVITDNIEAAKKAIKGDFSYINSSPIVDFYIGSRAKYFIGGNSTFSWWIAYLSNAQTIMPKNWYAGDFADCPTDDLYLDKWTLL